MVAVISGSGLGIFGSSVSALGGIGGSGNAAAGRGNDRVYVNTTTGNVIIQSQDERLSALGLDLNLIRTYNSQGLLDDDNGDNWRLGVHQRLYNLTGNVNTAGSTIIKVFGDGREVTYRYDQVRSAYISSEGDGAHDTLTFGGGSWTWKEGSSHVAETYDFDGQLTSARDADGNEVLYGYTDGRLTSIRDASRQVTELRYLGSNLTDIRVSSGGLTQTLTHYEYDTSNRLIEVRVDLTPANGADAVSYSTHYTYDGASRRVETITQSDGSRVAFTYELINGQYRVRTYTDGENRVTTFSYSLPSSGVQTTANVEGALLSTTRTAIYGLNTGALTSVDGWQAGSLMETGNDAARTPSIAFDVSGNGFAMWTQGSDVLVRRYIASTDTWSDAVTLDARAEEVSAEALLTVDRQTGDAIVAWAQSDGTANSLYVRRFNASTGTWGATQLLETAVGAVSLTPEGGSISINGNHAAVVWLQNDGVTNSVYLSRLVNGAWSAPALVDRSPLVASQPKVAVDAEGDVTILWRQRPVPTDDFRINARRWDASTQTFSPTTQLDGNGDRDPRIQLDQQGNGFALWGGGAYVRRFDAATGQWGAQIALHADAAQSRGAELAVDASGNALVAWMESDGTAMSMYARRYDASTGTWGAAQLLENSAYAVSIDHTFTVSLSGDNGVVAWIQEGAEPGGVVTAAKLSKGVWGPATQLESREESAYEVDSAIDAAGNATVLWIQADDHAPSVYKSKQTSSTYIVPSGATWQSVAQTLYGISSPAAGGALQAALGSPSLAAGSTLTGLPTTLSVITTVPPHYVVRGGDTWASITQALYGTSEATAIARLRTELGNPSLTVGAELTMPTTLTYASQSATALYLQTDVTDARGVVTRYEQDAAGRLRAVTQAPGGVALRTEYEYDAAGNVTAIIVDPNGLNRITTMQYDANGNLLYRCDAQGNTLTRIYDAHNRLSSETVYQARDPDGAGSATASVPLTTHYTYDDEHHLRFVISPTGRVTEHSYNAAGERTATVTYTQVFYSGSVVDTATLASWTANPLHAAEAERVEYEYDWRGNLEWQRAYATRDGYQWPLLTKFVYDQRGQLLQSINALGSQSTPDENDPNLPYSTTYTYDGLGRLLTVTQWISTDQQTSVVTTTLTTHTYDDANRSTATTFANGLVTTKLHNRAGEVISVLQAGGLLGTTSYAYDATGNLRMETDPLGQRRFHLYDAAGRRIASIDNDGTLTEFVYNAANQLIKTVTYAELVSATLRNQLASNNPAATLTALRAAADGNPAEDLIVRNVYDAAGQLIYTFDATGAVTKFIYDGTGRVTDEIRYARQIDVSRTVDQLLEGDFSITTHADDRHTRKFYDADGLLTGTLDAKGYLVENVYDAAGRLVRQIAYANDTALEHRASGTLEALRRSCVPDPEHDQYNYFFYDEQGRRIGSLDAEGYFTVFSYDLHGQLFEIRRTDDKLTYVEGTTTFDSLQRIVQMSWGTLHGWGYWYDGAGRLRFEKNQEGTNTEYTYDGVGNVVGTTRAMNTDEARVSLVRRDLLGRVTKELSAEGYAQITAGMSEADIEDIWSRYGTSYVYDLAGRRVSATSRPDDTQTNTTLYFYDADGRLRFEVNARGEVQERQYNALGQLWKSIVYTDRISTAGLTPGVINTLLTDRVNEAADESRDSLTVFTYALNGRLASTTVKTDARPEHDAVTTHEYDAFADERVRIESIDSARSLRHEYTYDKRGQLKLTRWDPLGLNTTEHREYDAFGRLVSVIDARSNETRTEYDRLGRAIATVDGLGNERTTTYDAFARAVRTRDALGNETTYSYSIWTHTSTIRTPEGIDIETTFNLHGQKVKVRVRYSETSYHYDLNGALQSVSDTQGTLETRTYDRAGRQLTQEDGRGATTSFTYDAANRVLTRTVDPGVGGVALTTTYEYDGQGRVRRVVEPGGKVTQTDYDRAGRVIMIAVDPDSLNLRTRYEYDRSGQVITVTEGYGDALGRERRTQYIYDTLGRRVEEIVDPTALGGTLNMRTQYKYDENGNLTRKIDAENHSTWFVYDAANRLEYTIDALGGVTKTGYDAENRIVATTRYATAISTSGFGDVVTSVPAIPLTNARVTRSLYDRDGREIYKIDALGGVTKRNYDQYGNVVRTQAYARPVEPTDYTIETLELQLRAHENDRLQWTVYDNRGNAIFLIDGTGAVVGNTYDEAGNLVSTIEYAQRWNYYYLEQPDDVWWWSYSVANDPANRTTRFWYDGATRLRFTLDAEGYLTERRYLDASRAEVSVVYAGKPAILPGATVADVSAAASNAPDQADNQATTRYFDAAGRVTQVMDAMGRSEYFGYDSVGNKTSYTNKRGAYAGDPAYTWNYEYDAAGRLIYERTPNVSYTVVREVDGVLIVDEPINARLVTQFEYDDLGNLRFRHEAYGTASGRTTEYIYDALGRQVRTNFPRVGVYDPDRDLLPLGTGGAVARAETADALLYTEVAYDALGNAYRNRDVAGEYSFKTYDALGRVTYEVDAENYVTQYEYDAFGNQTVLTRYANRLSVPLSETTATITQSDIAAAGLNLDPNADRVITTGYDKLNRVTSVTQRSVANYEPNVTAGQAGTTYTAGPTTLTEYNAFGDVVLVRKQLTNTPTYADTYFYYDRLGQKVAEVDPKGYLTTFAYDETGDLERTTEYARPRTGTLNTTTYGDVVTTTRENALNHAAGYDRETWFGYDRLNRKISETKKSLEHSTVNGTSVDTTVSDQVTTFAYDALGNQTQVTDHRGASTYTYYDVLGRSVAVAEPARDAGNGSTLIPYARFWRDAHGNLVQQINYGGGATFLDLDGELVAMPVAAPAATPNRTTTILVDRHGRAIRTRDASGADRFASYNARGDLAKEWQLVTNAGSAATTADDTTDTLVTVYEYDGLGRQTAVREPQRHTGGTVEVKSVIRYNAFGEIIEKGIVDGRTDSGRQEFFHYDQAGRVWRTNSGDGVVKVYLYNLAGQVTAELRSQTVNLGADSFTSAQQIVADVSAVHLMRTETRYDERGHVIEQRLPTFSTSNGPGQVATDVQVSDAPPGAGPITLPLSHQVIDSADWYSTSGPNGGQWINSNQVSLSWPPLGDGPVRIEIYYRSKNPDGTVGSNKIYSETRSGVSTGAMIEWQDSSTARQGGIQDVRQINVYGAGGVLLRALHVEDVPPTSIYVHWTGSISEFRTTFEYRPRGSTGDFTPLTLIDLAGDQVGVNVGALLEGTYEYRITYARFGDSTPYAQSTGTFTLGRVPGAPADPAYQVGQLSVTNPDGYIRWTANTDTSVTARLKYRASAAATWVEPALTAVRSGANFEIDARNALATAGNYFFEIEYVKAGQLIAKTTGSLYSTGQSTTFTNVTIESQSTEYYHWGASVTLDPLANSTDPDTRHADALNTTVQIGTVLVPSNPDYGYRRREVPPPQSSGTAYVYEWAPNQGGYNRQGQSGPYSVTAGRYIYWSDPPEIVGEVRTEFVYRVAGTTTWSTIPVEKVTTGITRFLGANLGVMGSETYEYQVRYYRDGDQRAFAVRTGTVTDPASATGVTDTTLNSVRSSDVLAPRTFQEVDRWGNVISTTDAAQKTTHYRFNQLGLLTERRLPTVEIVTVNALGTITPRTDTPIAKQYYDILGRLIATQDENGNVNAFTLNAAGQVIRETHANNTSRSATYDVFGNKVVEINERGFRSEHTYDTRNLLTQTVQDAGVINNWQAANLITTSFAYDQAGRRISQTDGNLLTTYNWYDLLGNLVKTVTPMGHVTSYEYDLQGNKTKETDAIGGVKHWTYDYHGRLQTHHELGSEAVAGTRHDYSYNNAGLLTSTTSTVGQRLTNIYDAAGHLLESNENGSPAAGSGWQRVQRRATFAYDIMGRQVHAMLHVDQKVEQDARVTYDAAGRLASMWDRGAGTQISYDAAGNRTRIQSSASATNNNAEFTTSPHTMTWATFKLISMDWYADQTAWDVANTDYWYAYDSMNRMTISRGRNDSGTVRDGVSITYDAAGNKETRSQNDYVYTWGSSSGVLNRTVQATNRSTDRYIYDGANRLTDVIRDGITVEHYEYDKGSRQTVAETSTPEPGGGGYYLVTRRQTSVYNDDNHLTSTTTMRRSSEPGKATSVMESIVDFGVDEAGVVRYYSVLAYNAGGTAIQYTLAYEQHYLLGESYLPTLLTMRRTSGTGGPQDNSTTRTYAQDGTLYSFSDELASNNNRRYIVNADGQIIASRQGPSTLADESRNFFVNGQNVGSLTLQRAPESWDPTRIAGFVFNVDDGVVSGAAAQLPSTVIAQSGETLRAVAQRVWGDANLWYLLAEENGLSDPDAALPEGTSLRVPNEIVSIRNSANVFRPYDANAAIGNTSPEQVVPYVPPPKGKKGCGVIGQILLIVVAVVVTYLTAGATSAYFAGVFGATGGAIVTGAVAAAAGSLASQGLSIAAGMQDSFDWKGLAAAAIGGAIGGALTNGIGIKGIPGEIAQGALNSALNQGVNIALGLQEEFNWSAVAAAAVAAPIASRLGKAASGKFANKNVAEAAGSLTKGLVNQAAYAAFAGGKINYVQLAADAFGNALGSEIADAIEPTPHERRMKMKDGKRQPTDSAYESAPLPEPTIGSPLDDNPDLFANLPMPVASFADGAPAASPTPRVANDPVAEAKVRDRPVAKILETPAVVTSLERLDLGGDEGTGIETRRNYTGRGYQDADTGKFSDSVASRNSLRRTRQDNVSFGAEVKLGEEVEFYQDTIKEFEKTIAGGDDLFGGKVGIDLLVQHSGAGSAVIGEDGLTLEASRSYSADATYAAGWAKSDLGEAQIAVGSVASADVHAKLGLKYVRRTGRVEVDIGTGFTAETALLKGVVEGKTASLDLGILELALEGRAEGHVVGIGVSAEAGLKSLKSRPGLRGYVAAGLTAFVGIKGKVAAEVSIAPRVVNAYNQGVSYADTLYNKYRMQPRND